MRCTAFGGSEKGVYVGHGSKPPQQFDSFIFGQVAKVVYQLLVRTQLLCQPLRSC